MCLVDNIWSADERGRWHWFIKGNAAARFAAFPSYTGHLTFPSTISAGFPPKDFHMISDGILHMQGFLNATIVSWSGCLICQGFLHFLGRVPWGEALLIQMLLFANVLCDKYILQLKQIYLEIWANIMCTLNKYERVPWGYALLMQMLVCANGLRDNIFLVCIKFPLKWRHQWSKKASSS